jgi:hypothetical protein
MSMVVMTKHAVDRASQRLLSIWAKECPRLDPGLYTWLQHIADQVWALHRVPGRHVVGPIKFVIKIDERGRPMLVTVARVGSRRLRQRHADHWAKQQRRKQAEGDAVGENKEYLG